VLKSEKFKTIKSTSSEKSTSSQLKIEAALHWTGSFRAKSTRLPDMPISDFEKIAIVVIEREKNLFQFFLIFGEIRSEIWVGELWPKRDNPQLSKTNVLAPMGPTEMIFVSDWRYLKDPSGQTDENLLK